jgi:ketosteroid isomerase-like protein
MSRENPEADLAHVCGLHRRDLDAMLALMHDEVEIEPRVGALDGGYRGHRGARRWWSNLLDFLPDYTADVEELQDLGDVTLARIRGRGHGAASTTLVVETWWQSIRWRDGRCVWWRNLATEADALETIQLEAR